VSALYRLWMFFIRIAGGVLNTALLGGFSAKNVCKVVIWIQAMVWYSALHLVYTIMTLSADTAMSIVCVTAVVSKRSAVVVWHERW